jgi:hypothetical protein
MPLVEGKSKQSFEKNLKTEMHHDKPLKQSLAIAYAMKRKAQKKKAMGGDASMCEHGGPEKCSVGCYAEGGAIDSWTRREDNEKGVHRAAPTDQDKGRSTSGAALHPSFSISDEMDVDAAKMKHKKVLDEIRSMKKPDLMAEGGYIGSYKSNDSDPDLDGDDPSPMMEESIEHPDSHDSMISRDVVNQLGDEDEGFGDMDAIHPAVLRIMMGHEKGYSEGGQVANEETGESTTTPEKMAKWKDNEFDNLALRDDLEFDSTGTNAGDSFGDAREDEDRNDIVSRIMRSRAKKDRMAVSGEGSTYGRRK